MYLGESRAARQWRLVRRSLTASTQRASSSPVPSKFADSQTQMSESELEAMIMASPHWAHMKHLLILIAWIALQAPHYAARRTQLQVLVREHQVRKHPHHIMELALSDFATCTRTRLPLDDPADF